MRRSLAVFAFTLALMTGTAGQAFAGQPTYPGAWGGTILCIIGYHAITNPAHPEWGNLGFCLQDRP